MPQFKEDHEHLTQLAAEFRRLADRTDQARKTAIGWSDFGPGVAHDAALNESIDWFYRRWVQQVEAGRDLLNTGARLLTVARGVYEATEGKIAAAAGQRP